MILACACLTFSAQARHIVNISRAAELQAILADPDADINILADIDASTVELRPDGAPFRGNIYGNGHMISNLRITADGKFAGLFGRMEGCNVSDLVLADAVFTPAHPAAEYAGVLCGEAVDCRFTNVRVCYTKAASESFSGVYGGLAGVTRNSEIRLSMSADADVDLPGAKAVGGLVGRIGEKTTIAVSAASGRLRGDTNVGGIAGESESGSGAIVNCHSNSSLWARHTVGGIIGHSRRIELRNCLVDGRIEASAEESAIGPAAGGVVGSLDANPKIYDNPSLVSVALVYYNIVQLTGIHVPKEYPAEDYRRQYNTAHRIVGASVDNEPPQITGTTDEGEPIYDSRRFKENALNNNYASSFLEVIDPAIDDSKSSTEGLSYIAEDMDMVFLQQQAFRLGYTQSSPWVNPRDNHGMRLFFERKALNISCDPQRLSLEEGDEAEVAFTVTGCTADWLDIRATHAYALDILHIEYEGRKAIVHIYARMACDTDLTASADGLTAVCKVNATEISGLDDTVAASARLTYDGASVRHTDGEAMIQVYSLDGRQVASGQGAVEISQLPSGSYIAVSGQARLKIMK